MAIDITSHRSATDDSYYLTAKVTVSDLMLDATRRDFYDAVVLKMAERFVEDNYQELAEKMDQQAIANLAVAESARKIADAQLAKPTVVRETKTEVYQRGILGGVRRVF